MSTEILIALVGIGVNVFGFYLVLKQVRQQALATRGDTYTNLCGLSYDILRLIADQPYLYDYVYNDKRISSQTPGSERVQVLICCEMIANYCDNVALQRENIPDAIWQRWRTFIREQVAASGELNVFLRQNASWYSPDLVAVLDEVPAAPSLAS